jgi:hypothetical protein
MPYFTLKALQGLFAPIAYIMNPIKLILKQITVLQKTDHKG